MRRQVLPALRLLLVLTVLTGVLYPLAVTGIAQLAFPGQANGSLVGSEGRVVGSTLQGQPFATDAYFHPRPSAAGYDGTATAGSNLGPTNPELAAAVADRVALYRERNALDADIRVPVDAVTASGSGIDPHISLANARLQAPRVAAARGLDVDVVLDLVAEHADGRILGFLGEPRVNVLLLNLALDRGAG
jgi:potassium-transporting ATPase KdpC subunit